MKVCEIFSSIQGEGRYCGTPMTFIRLSGCTRECSFCDTKYHKEKKEINDEKLLDKVKDSYSNIICWTGGEPLIQIKDIEYFCGQLIENEDRQWKHHLETNGDLLNREELGLFDYVAISPKNKWVARRVRSFLNDSKIDIKVVTDLDKIGLDMIKYATMLMPLTGTKNDLKIAQKVWNYCIKHNLKYSPRIHYDLWKTRRKK